MRCHALFSLLRSVCVFFLFARRRNKAKPPEQGSSVSDGTVGHSTGQIKHTDLKERSAPQTSKLDRLTQRTPAISICTSQHYPDNNGGVL